jgi:UDP-N-acetylmuramate dehydrogenase
MTQMQVKQNYSLLNHNTFAIDVRANVVISYDNEEELKEMARDGFSNYPRPILHIGHGSNLLFMNDFEGTVLLSNITTIEVLREDDTEIVVRAGAGLTMDDFIEHCIAQGWYGLENLSLIPGQVGASAVQNIGAYGVEVCDHIKRVNCVSLSDGKEISFAREECDYAYRHSIFKTPEYRGAYAVVSVEFVLNKRFTPQLAYGGIVKSL